MLGRRLRLKHQDPVQGPPTWQWNSRRPVTLSIPAFPRDSLLMATLQRALQSSSPSRQPLQIHILPLTWTDLKYRYTYSEVWPTLREADLGTSLLVLSPPDFQAYDWTHHELWLRADTVDRLQATGLNQLFREAADHAFVVTLEGQRMYGGLFYYEGGAAAIRFPVIHVLGAGHRVLRIRPALGAGSSFNDPRFAAEMQWIGAPQLGAWLQSHHLLATTPVADRPQEHSGW